MSIQADKHVDIKSILNDRFGFHEFRDGQEKVIHSLMKGHSALAVFPTGGGKSICYQLPALTFEGVTIVVSPLIALMKDQIDFLQSKGAAAARLDSSLSASESAEVNEKMKSGALKLLYVAPERFNNQRFVESLRRIKISLLAIDEAHCISEWGHNFRPDYLKLAEVAKSLKVERVLTLTATASPAVVKDICVVFDIHSDNAIVTGFYRHNLQLAMTAVEINNRDDILLKRIKSRKPGPTIVYVTLQKTAERVAKYLHTAGFQARGYHAGMDIDDRTAVQEEWMASDAGIVVATIAFGMGIDKADVRYVYHYNLPKSLESYSQEIGRAGRDGKPSTVELLICQDDVPTLENFAFGDTPTETSLRSLVEELFSQPKDFDVSLYDLSVSHDMRLLVLRTALTYLELLGSLHQGTPFYTGYKFRPLVDFQEIWQQFQGEPGQFVKQIFEQSKKGRTWHTINPDDAAKALGQERKRIVRALEVMEEQGLMELQVSEVRQRFTRLREKEDKEKLISELVEKFHKREKQENTRLQHVLKLASYEGCQSNALVGYFGQKRKEACGHCSFCKTKQAVKLIEPKPSDPLPAQLNVETFKALRKSNPEALKEPRQCARFLCGLTSPALTKAKLSRHEMFGVWENRRFREVMDWVKKGG